MKKKFLTAAITATIALGCAITSFAAEPVYFNDFESGVGDATIVGSGAIEDDADENYGKVFHNNVSGDTTVRSNYLLLPEDVFSDLATNKELTVQFWVNKGTATNYFYAPIFAAYAAKADENSWPCLILQSRLVGQVNCAGYTDWTKDDYELELENEDVPVDTSWLDDGEWHLYTAVLTETSSKIYIDGNLVRHWTFDGTDGHNQSGLFTSGSELKYVCVGGNQGWTWADADAAYKFDDVSIYNTALTVAEIQSVIEEKNASEDAPSTEEPTSVPSNPDGEDIETEPATKPDETDPTTKPDSGNDGKEEETTAPSPEGGNAEVVKATVVSAEVAAEVAKAAVVTSADGKVLDVVITATPVEDTALVEGLVEANSLLQEAGVKALAVLDLKLMVGDKAVTLLDNKINVNIPMDKIFEDIAADALVAVYRVDGESLSYLGTSKVAADKTITFATEHFSQYVFVIVENEVKADVVEYVKDIDTTATPDVKVADIPVKANASVEDPDKNTTGDTTPIMPLVVLAVVALGGVVAAVATKKRA